MTFQWQIGALLVHVIELELQFIKFLISIYGIWKIKLLDFASFLFLIKLRAFFINIDLSRLLRFFISLSKACGTVYD